jgi:sn-glycerol 3-phosphate transport system ATP-binding protein
MPTLNLNDIRKSFGTTDVLHGISIDVREGEFIVLVGPSGCGKSTLLRMVAGLEDVTSGDITIAGRRVNDLEPMERNIAMVFQNYALYPHMSVFDNMAYGLKIAGTPKAEIAERVAVAAKMLQLEPYLKRRPRELSGGQRQRVAMGRAIVRKPDVFLFDEPLSNLDAKLRVQMRLEIKALQRQLGVTSIYVTHDQVEAMTLADRMIVMNAGHAEQIGAPLEVYANPASVFVAEFIGSPPMNVQPGGVFGSSAPMAGVRPEQLRFDDLGPLCATVTGTEALGAETLVYLRTEQSGLICLRQDGQLPLPAPGDTRKLAWESGALALFGVDGRRVT